MLDALSPRQRALLNSFAYTVLVALVAALGYLTYRAANIPREATAPGNELDVVPLVEFDNFSSRLERSSDNERVTLSVRLRSTAPGRLDCQVYFVARNDHVTPKLWGVWPAQGPDGAMTMGGHFRAGDSRSGEPVSLSPAWTKVTASIAHPLGLPPYDTVMIYVVGPKGGILLTRPFALT